MTHFPESVTTPSLDTRAILRQAEAVLSVPSQSCFCGRGVCYLERREREEIAREALRLQRRDQGRGVQAPTGVYVEMARRHLVVEHVPGRPWQPIRHRVAREPALQEAV